MPLYVPQAAGSVTQSYVDTQDAATLASSTTLVDDAKKYTVGISIATATRNFWNG